MLSQDYHLMKSILFQSLCTGGKCINDNGSFKCECLDGFVLGPDGRTCTDSVQGLCYSNYEGGQCQNPSLNLVSKSTCCCGSVTYNGPMGWGTPCQICPPPGSPDFHHLCPHGAGFTNSGDDINECAAGGDNPCGDHGACENLIGGYRCLCNEGYKLDFRGKKCIDIDECEDSTICANGGHCRNFPGTFQCVCPPGRVYNKETKNCDDEDECLDDSMICGPNGRCINKINGYTCECSNGWILNEANGVPHCVDSRKGSCWGQIVGDRCEANFPFVTLRAECCCSANNLGLAWGSPCERCKTDEYCGDCPAGMMPSSNGKTCVDINECNLNPDLCQGGVCLNTEGGFICRCPPGLRLDETGTYCSDDRREPCFLDNRQGLCSKPMDGAYKKDQCCCTMGEGWGNSCYRCPRPGTAAFDKLCPMGKGFVPGIGDINECLSFPNICNNGRCKNTRGGFICRCNQGYALDEYGTNCININECAIMSAGGVCGNGTCIDTEGSFRCECDEGFHTKPPMTQICMDVDECGEDPTLCRGGRCINTPGSFVCECPLGLELTEDGRRCKDIDECSRNNQVCSNGVCENMMGAYQCVCEEGFKQASSGTSCVDVDECARDNGGCDDVCINTPGNECGF